MKTIGMFILALGMVYTSHRLQAQTLLVGGFNNVAAPVQPAQSDSIVQITAEAQGLQAISLYDLPFGGTYWWVMPGGAYVPMPCPPTEPTIPIYAITDSQFLVDETGGQVLVNTRRIGGQATSAMISSTLATQSDEIVGLITQIQTTAARQQLRASMRAMGMDLPSLPGDGDFGGGTGGDYTNSFNFWFDRTQLWLEITNVSNGWANLNLHNATNLVYAIWSTTNLATPCSGWQVETEVWPTDTNCQPFTVATLDRQNLFLRAEDWTGVDSDGDGIPDWWIWKYYGNLFETATNLDADGNSLLFDYTNNYVPSTFNFSAITVTNNYVNSSSVPAQLSMAGSPYYIAILVDDTNFADAIWNTYSPPNITINLGATEGWHNVWIGLRGHADDASAAVWQWTRLKLDFTPPALVITGPTNGTVTVPMIQLTGYGQEALSAISYDLSNATGLVTNQPILIEGQFYDPTTAEFNTNYFQGYDIPLTNGLNVLTLHAMDLAGNMTTLTTNIQCTGNPNPPVVTLLWPQDGMQISGSNITIQGQVDDPMATVSVAVVDANGNTNSYNGLTGRDGIFWIENVALNSATNTLALTLNNAAGTTITNFTLMESSVGLTVDAVQAGDTTVYGSLDTDSYTVWVNGAQATNNGDGTWTAQITPIGIGGGLVKVMAIPDTTNGGNPNINSQATVQPPQGVFVSGYHCYTEHWNGFWIDSLDWQDGVGGNAKYHWDGTGDVTSDSDLWLATSWPEALPAGDETDDVEGTSTASTAPSPDAYIDERYWMGEPWMIWAAGEGEHTYVTNQAHGLTLRTADSEQKLATGGPLGSKQMNLWCISATATDEDTGLPIPPEKISIGSFGNLDTNGNLYVVLPDNDPDVITPMIAGIFNYTFTKTVARKVTKIVYFSIAPVGEPSRTFHASDIENNLQSQLMSKVFDHLPKGFDVRVQVVEEATFTHKKGWDGNTYYQRVTWDITGIPSIRKTSEAKIQISPTDIEQAASMYIDKNVGTQTWVNILAHEGVWGNAGNNGDCNPIWPWSDCETGEISAGTLGVAAYLFDPFFVHQDSRTTLRQEILGVQ